MPPPRNDQLIDASRLGFLVVLLVGLGASLLAVMKGVSSGPMALLSWFVLLGLGVWFITARSAWWIPIPVATAFGGLFWVGFRIHSHELALVMSAVALVPLYAMKWRPLFQQRTPLSPAVYLLCAYLIVHLGFSLLIAKHLNERGLGNIIRTYMGGLWAVLFVLAFHHFGSCRPLRGAVILIYVALVVRVAIGLYSYFNPGFIYFPVIGAFFLLSERGANELRDAPLRLIILAIGLLASTSTKRWRTVHLLVVLCSSWMLLLGSSRVSVGMLLGIPLIWLVLQRRWALLGGTVVAVAAAVIWLNANPNAIDPLPDSTRRSLSILLFNPHLEVHRAVEGSNEWHDYLAQLGRQKWMGSIGSFFAGNRVLPFDRSFYAMTADFFLRANIAASTARYESALWTVMATLGVIGACLYLVAFRDLLRGPFRALRRSGVRDFDHAIYFVALTQACLLAAFCWISGSFPGNELAMAGIARALYDDRWRLAETPAPPPDGASGTRPP
jgi:hypothetical protein